MGTKSDNEESPLQAIERAVQERAKATALDMSESRLNAAIFR